jgi:hypothetical protein
MTAATFPGATARKTGGEEDDNGVGVGLADSDADTTQAAEPSGAPLAAMASLSA